MRGQRVANRPAAGCTGNLPIQHQKRVTGICPVVWAPEIGVTGSQSLVATVQARIAQPVCVSRGPIGKTGKAHVGRPWQRGTTVFEADPIPLWRPLNRSAPER